MEAKRLALDLEEHAYEIASDVLVRMQTTHPDESVESGREGQQRCFEDIVYHVQHLAAALDVGDPALFDDYRGWLTSVLRARDVSLVYVWSGFEALAEELVKRLGDEAAPAVALLERRDQDPDQADGETLS